jgi:hypothetical protein
LTGHPSSELLALYGSADLPLLERWRIRRHLTRCEQCERQFSVFRASTVELKRMGSAETLTSFEAIADWSRLEREMEGNIVVGLDAARCIDKKRSPRGLLLKFAAAAGMGSLFVLGWATHVPAEQSARMFTALRGAFGGHHVNEYQGPILRSVPDGIVVGSPESSMTILHPATAVVSASGAAGVEARYVDDTGQVTITDVYGQ